MIFLRWPPCQEWLQKVEIFSLLSLLKYRSPSSPTRKGLSAPLKSPICRCYPQNLRIDDIHLWKLLCNLRMQCLPLKFCLIYICLWLCTVTRVTGAAHPADQSRRLIYSAMRVRTQTKIVRHRKIRRIRIWKWNVGNVAFILSWPSKSHPAWSDHLCLSHSCCFRELTTGNFWSTWPCVSTSTHQDRLNIPCNM